MNELDRKILPKSWQWAKLSEVCQRSIVNRDPTRQPDIEFIYIDISSVDNQKKAIVTPQSLLGRNAPSRARQVVELGDVIVATTRPNLNAVALIPQELDSQICSTGFCVLRAIPEVLSSEFLFLWVRHPDFIESLSDLVKGALYPAVTDNQVLAQYIPLPPLSEQKRIAAILKEQLAAVEQARKASEARMAAARALPAAYLRELFSNAKAKWNTIRIGDVASIQSGYAFKSEWFSLQGIRLLRNANVFQGYIDWQDVVYLPIDRRNEFQSYELRENDIVISLDRPLVKAGLKASKITQSDIPSLLLQRVGRFQIFGDIDPDYLFIFLNSDLFTGKIVGHDYSIGVPHISPAQIEAIELPFPSLIEQKSIAKFFNAKNKAINKMISEIEQEQTALNKMAFSLLRAAFNGFYSNGT